MKFNGSLQRWQDSATCLYPEPDEASPNSLNFFFNRHYNPSWVSACSTVVEHSQQEGFTECRCQRSVKPPTLRRTSALERSNFRHKRSPASEATLANPAVEGGTMGEKWPRILPKVTTSTSLFGSFTCRKARHGTDGFTFSQLSLLKSF
jgi:hypothetical protein